MSGGYSNTANGEDSLVRVEDKYVDIDSVMINLPSKVNIPNFLRGMVICGARNSSDNGDGVKTDGVEEWVT